MKMVWGAWAGLTVYRGWVAKQAAVLTDVGVLPMGLICAKYANY